MEKVLLTWYGITDLKASLGFERGLTGPILSALSSEKYSTVVILGCTFRDRCEDVKDIARESFEAEIKAINVSDYKSTTTFIQKYANTQLAHDHYCEWLKASLEKNGIIVNVIFQKVMLKKLNDTDGIYEAANRALTVIAQTCATAMVTLFLSPGTPVMAFVWAMAALNFPRLKKRLISSSVPEKGPEIVKLPEEWLEWNAVQACRMDNSFVPFDVCFHLFGDQRLPTYWGMRQYQCKKHVIITSEEYSVDCLKPFLSGAKIDILRVDPYNPEDVRSKILQYVKARPEISQIGFNLTGGTKLMYAGAISACRKVNGVPFYFNLQNFSVTNLSSFKAERIRGIDTIEPFFALNGDQLKVSNSGRWEKIPDINLPGREELTRFLKPYAWDIDGCYMQLCKLTDTHSKENKKSITREGFVPFYYSDPKGFMSASIDQSARAIFTANQTQYVFGHFPGFAKFITGGWWEELVYRELKPLENEGIIFDLRIGFEVSFESDEEEYRGRYGLPFAKKEDRAFQEIDIAFTDGSRLYIIECKAGWVKSDHVMKLENIVRKFGGVGGRGFLLSCLGTTDETVKKRIKESKSCRLVSGFDIAKQIRDAIAMDRASYLK